MRGQFADLLFIKRLNFFKTFLHFLAQYEIGPKVLLPYTRQLLNMLLHIGDMTAYGISYHTVDPQGMPVLASLSESTFPVRSSRKASVSFSPEA